MEFHLRNFTVHKGEKVSGFLDLPFTDEGLPATVIYGRMVILCLSQEESIMRSMWASRP